MFGFCGDYKYHCSRDLEDDAFTCCRNCRPNDASMTSEGRGEVHMDVGLVECDVYESPLLRPPESRLEDDWLVLFIRVSGGMLGYVLALDGGVGVVYRRKCLV